MERTGGYQSLMEASDLERPMKRLFPLVMVVAACGPGVYTRAEVVYAEPADHVYVVPTDRVIVVTREVLVQRGYVVYRVENRGSNRIVWARRLRPTARPARACGSPRPDGPPLRRRSPVQGGPPPGVDRRGRGAAPGRGSPRRRRTARAGAPLRCGTTPAAGPAPPGRVGPRLTVAPAEPSASKTERRYRHCRHSDTTRSLRGLRACALVHKVGPSSDAGCL